MSASMAVHDTRAILVRTPEEILCHADAREMLGGKNMNAYRSVLLSLLVVAVFSLQPAYAVDDNWINRSGGWFGLGSNWSSGAVPGSGDTAVFSLGAPTYNVTFDTNYTNAELRIRNDAVSLDLRGFTYDISSGHANVTVGQSAGEVGKLTVSGGVLSDTSGYVAYDADSCGTVVVSAGAKWQNSESLTVGVSGAGSLNIEGGSVSCVNGCVIGANPGATGTVTVDGPGATLSITPPSPDTWCLMVGDEGTGYLNVLNGGRLLCSGKAFVGGLPGLGTGVALVEGQGSLLRTEDLYVSAIGRGTLMIRDGGRVETQQLLVSHVGSGFGLVEVEGPGSALVVSGGGMGGPAYCSPGLIVRNGGLVQWGSFWEMRGGAVVQGEGSTLTLSGQLEVNGSLTIQDGGYVSSAGGSLGGSVSYGFFDATVTGAGSRWVCSGPMYLGGDSFNQISGSGSLRLSSGGRVSCYDLTLWGSGSLDVNGGTVEASSVESAGIITIESGWLAAANSLVSSGQILLASPTANIALNAGAGSLSNSGLVSGTGRIAARLTNAPDGEVRVAVGDNLIFTGGADNSGQVSLLGGTVEFSSLLTNHASGFVAGQGTLVTKGGLTNQGTIATTAGSTSFLGGDVTNAPGGRIIVSGGGTATFYDDVINNGAVFQVSDGCTAVFFGSFSGSGTTGGGRCYFEGDLRPGASPATISFGGNVVFSSTSRLVVDLDGTTPGTQYDQVNVAGTATLGGTLEVVNLIDGFRPAHNDTFRVMTFGSRAGTFASVTGLDRGNRLTLVPIYSGTDLELVAVQGGSGTWGSDASGMASRPANWTGGIPNGVGDTATFGPVIQSPREVTVDAATVLGAMVFDSAKAYTVTGPETVTLQAGGAHTTISVTSASGTAHHVISAPLTLLNPLDIDNQSTGDLTFAGPLNDLAGLTIKKTGSGAVTFEGPLTFGVGSLLVVSDGTVNLDSDAGELSANLSIDVTNAVVNFGCNQHLDTLEIGGGGRVTFTGAHVVVLNHLVIGGMDLGAMTMTPEPATLGLLALGGVAAFRRRQR